MSTIQIHLNDNTYISASSDSFDVQSTADNLNDQKILALSIGDFVLNKNSILAMAVENATPNVKITLQNGLIINTYSDSYQASDITNKMNGAKQLITVGETVINKNAIRMVTPIS